MEKLNVEATDKGFGIQGVVYDRYDFDNDIAIFQRKQVRQHIEECMKGNGKMLEINCGSGLDLLYFARQGNEMTGLDISKGMLKLAEQKLLYINLKHKVKLIHGSFDDLSVIPEGSIDYVYSVFGGLNCTKDLDFVKNQIIKVLKPGGRLSLVIMPKYCPWEIVYYLLKFDFKRAFRRISKSSTVANVGGEKIEVWYHSAAKVKSVFSPECKHIHTQSIGLFVPPPFWESFPWKHPLFFKLLKYVDDKLANHWPFNVFGDYYIASFEVK